jgi:hypothetical protein
MGLATETLGISGTEHRAFLFLVDSGDDTPSFAWESMFRRRRSSCQWALEYLREYRERFIEPSTS